MSLRTKSNRGKNRGISGVYMQYMSIMTLFLPTVGALGDKD